MHVNLLGVLLGALGLFLVFLGVTGKYAAFTGSTSSSASTNTGVSQQVTGAQTAAAQGIATTLGGTTGTSQLGQAVVSPSFQQGLLSTLGNYF